MLTLFADEAENEADGAVDVELSDELLDGEGDAAGDRLLVFVVLGELILVEIAELCHHCLAQRSRQRAGLDRAIVEGLEELRHLDPVRRQSDLSAERGIRRNMGTARTN